MIPISAPEWAMSSAWPPALASDQLHVWRVSLDASPCRQALLSEPERLRLRGFANETLAHRFCAMRSALRRLLGGYCGISAAAVPLQLSESGKPSLAGDSPLQFNLSHSQGFGLIAFAHAIPLGVDLEYRRPLPDWQRIARRMFTADACSAIEAAEDTTRAFFQYWTALEARQKCIGQGIFGPAAEADGIAGVQFEPGRDLFGALAWADPDWLPQLQFLDFDRCSESIPGNR
jgi:4'-phosphopantetheinyl transferase